MSHGSEKRVRVNQLTIRLAPDEHAAVCTAAERSGLTTASYARQVLLGAPAPRQVRRPQIERRELARLLGQLGSIGNNMNQVAKLANFGDPVDRARFAEALDGLRQMRDAVLKALGRDS